MFVKLGQMLSTRGDLLPEAYSTELAKLTTGRFEIERNGEVAYLEYTLAGNILELTHTEVPEKVRHMGLASSLAETLSTGPESTISKSTLFVIRCGTMWRSTPSTQILLCIEMAGATGLEPAISSVTGRRSNQLNYAPLSDH